MDVKLKQKRNNIFRAQLIKKATKEELIFKKLLDKMNIRYIFQKGFIKGFNHCIVDFYLPRRRLCIEIDGPYHDSPKQKIRDASRDKYLTDKRKFRVIHFKNEEIINMTEAQLHNII